MLFISSSQLLEIRLKADQLCTSLAEQESFEIRYAEFLKQFHIVKTPPPTNEQIADFISNPSFSF